MDGNCNLKNSTHTSFLKLSSNANIVQCNESSVPEKILTIAELFFSFQSPLFWIKSNDTMSNQSPINIDTRTVIPKIYPPIVMSGHAEARAKLTLINTGHTAEIRPSVDSPGAFLSGGSLNDTYKFLQLHFHWGSTDAMGSEHSVNGNFYSMEAHFVHYNEKYENMENSIKESDGIAVVAIFFEVNSEHGYKDDSAMEKITKYLPSVRAVGTKMKIHPDVLEWVQDYCFCCSEYYTYRGSLTTHPFTENVIWVIYPVPVTVSKRQIDSFRHLNSSGRGTITSNNRETQLLGGRKVYLVKDSFQLTNKDEDHKGQANLSSIVNNSGQMCSCDSKDKSP